MGANPPTGDADPRLHPWLTAIAFYVAYVGISIGIHWITGHGFPSDFITEHLIGGVVATAIYMALTIWLARRRSGQRRR